MNDSLTKPSPVTRILDSIDHGHARAADRLHTARNNLRALVERALDRAEASIQSLRGRLDTIDKTTADRIIRAQGVAGAAIEKLRHVRATPGHVTS